MQPLQRENIRLAATVMLIRDHPSGLQVYMVKRPGRGDFPDLHVFPGGKVDEDDWQPDLCPMLTDQEASARLGVAAGGLRYWVAVARECFEECGVLLANAAGGPVQLDAAQQPVLVNLVKIFYRAICRGLLCCNNYKCRLRPIVWFISVTGLPRLRYHVALTPVSFSRRCR